MDVIAQETIHECLVSKPDEEKEDACLATSGSRPVKSLPQQLRIFECKGDDAHATSVIMCAVDETSATDFLNKTDFRLSSIVECDLDKKWIVLNEYDGYEYYEFSDKEESDSGPMHTVVSKLLPNSINDYLNDNKVTLLFGEYDLNEEYTIGVFNHIF